MYFSKGLANPIQAESERISEQQMSENSEGSLKQSDVKPFNKQETDNIKKSNPSKIALCNLK